MSRRIMILEDDRTISLSLIKVLEFAGYTPSSAVNGEQALAMLEAADMLPELIIVDVMMPVMGGMEFRERQLKNEKLKNIPIIFLTATDIDRSELMKLNPYECLLKPIDLNDFLKILENFFSLNDYLNIAES